MRSEGRSQTPYEDVSYWLSSCGPLNPRPPLDRSTKADIAILGAGYTGLWTAHYLLQRDPGLRVAVVERDIAGFGASGRNGGWCSSNLNASPALLTQRFGRAGARAVMQAMYEAVDEVGRQAAANGIDCDFEKAGELLVARGKHQLPALAAARRESEEAGLGDRYDLLDRARCDEMVKIAGAEGALYSRDCAILHPAKLVRGLAEAVERRGGVIYEQSAVRAFRPGRQPQLLTERGEVSADVIVLAGEAYLTELRPLHRRLLPIYSLIVLSEPVPEELMGGIGWKRRVCLASTRLTIDYLSRTADGRVLFGGRGAPYNFGSAIRPETENHAPTHEMLRQSLVDWFPALQGIRFTHAWGGVLGMPRDWIPSITYEKEMGVAMAYGYTGHGVAASNLAGRALADLITGNESSLTELPLVGHRSRSWEPEPFRWLGVRFIQREFQRLDSRGERTGRAPSGRSLAERLAAH